MLKILTVFLSVAIPVSTTLAQVNTAGRLHGIVTDQQNDGVPGASIELKNIETSSTQAQVSGAGGEYAFGRVTPGRYAVTVTKEGFQTSSKEGIVVDVNDAAVADVLLLVGQASQVVNVGSGADVVKSQSTEVSLLVN